MRKESSIFKSQFSKTRGIALLVAIIITGTLLLVATAISNIALKESVLSAENSDSQYAFYAADSGVECALYWDVKNPSGSSAFATSTGSQIQCNKDAANSGNDFVVGGSAQSQFTMTFLPDPYCVRVVVTKNADNTTLIQSYGYNTCDAASPRRVERAVQVNY